MNYHINKRQNKVIIKMDTKQDENTPILTKTLKKEVPHEKCKKCKSWRLTEHFLNKTGRRLKTCIKCRERSRDFRKKQKNLKK